MLLSAPDPVPVPGDIPILADRTVAAESTQSAPADYPRAFGRGLIHARDCLSFDLVARQVKERDMPLDFDLLSYQPLAELRALRTEKFNTLQNLANMIRTAQGRAKANGGAPRDTADLQASITDFESLESELHELDALIADHKGTQHEDAQPRQTKPMAPGSGGTSPPSRLVLQGAHFSDLFATARRGSSAFHDFGTFAAAVVTRDPRLHDVRNSSGMSEGVGADGGFAVPSELFYPLMDKSLGDEIVRRFATVLPMSSSTLDIPVFDSTDRTKGVAGLLGRTTGEGVAASTQKPVLSQLTLRATKFITLVPSTLELMQDAPRIFGGLLETHMVKAMGASLDDAFINGDGAGQPLGLLNAPCKVTVAKETSPAQGAATVLAPNVAKMAGRLLPGSWSRAIWICAPSVLPQLYQMQSKVLNQAASEYVGGSQTGWFSVDSTGNMTLLGRPLHVSDKCQQVGTEGDLILADLSTYYIGLRQDASLSVDYSKGFAESEAWFRLSMRVDGQPSLRAPITPRKGTDSLSSIVTLAVRG